MQTQTNELNWWFHKKKKKQKLKLKHFSNQSILDTFFFTLNERRNFRFTRTCNTFLTTRVCTHHCATNESMGEENVILLEPHSSIPSVIFFSSAREKERKRKREREREREKYFSSSASEEEKKRENKYLPRDLHRIQISWIAKFRRAIIHLNFKDAGCRAAYTGDRYHSIDLIIAW